MNRYSKERQYTTPRSPYDMDFIAQAMAYKQSKMDANRAMIQQNIDNIVGLDIDKPESREYLNKRVEQLLANVNQYGAVDLSSDGIARNIASYVSSAIDDTVINAYAGTMEGRKMEKYYDDLLINDPNKYNERNKAFAMAPYYQWLQDGQAGSRLAPLQVSNYVDYREEAENVLKQVREAQKSGQEIQYPDPNNPGYMITEKIDQMTEDQVQQIAYNMMSEGAKKQMYIDGWYMSQTQPELFTNDALSGYVNTFNQSFDRKRDAIRAEMAGAISDPRRYNELYAAYQTLIDKKESFNTRAQQIFGSGDAAQMGAFMVENNFLNGLGKTWAYSNSTKKYSEDGAYWKRLEYERNVWKDQENAALQREKLKLAKEAEKRQQVVSEAQINKLNAEAAKALKESNGKGGVGSNGTNLSDVGTVVNEAVNTSGELVPGEEYVTNRINKARKDREDNVTKLIQSLDPTNRRELQAWVEERKSIGDPEFYDLSDGEMVLAYFDKNGGAANPMLSYGDARAAYLSAKESELVSRSALKAVDDFSNYQNGILGDVRGKTGINNFATPSLALAGFVDYAYSGIATEYQPTQLTLNDSAGSNAVLGSPYTPAATLRHIGYEFDADKVESPSMTSLVRNIGEMYGYDNMTTSDVFDKVDGRYYLKKDNSNPVVAGLKRIVEDKKDKDIANTRAGAILSAAGSALGPAGAIAANIVNSSIQSSLESEAAKMGYGDDVVQSINELYNKNSYDQIADDAIRTMTTPLGYIVNNDAKIDSEQRKVYNTLMNLYKNAANLGLKTQSEVDKFIGNQRSVVATSVVDNDGNIKYGLYINGDKSTLVEVDKQTLINNNIAIDEGNLFPVESIPHTERGVFFPDINDVDYARQIAGMTGLAAITSKVDMFNDIADSYANIFKTVVNEDTGEYNLTPMGHELEELVLGADKFDVGIQGYKSSGISGLKVFLYDKSQSVSSRQPIYQYSMQLDSGNEAYRWLQACPQYYIYRAYNMMINQYIATKSRGSEAGKEGFNKALSVVRR